MKKIDEKWYKADAGNHFVLTELGKQKSASYRNKEVGKPVSDYETEGICHDVDAGYVIEVEDPDWITCTGYRVVYDHKGTAIWVGNGTIFPAPAYELAVSYRDNMSSMYSGYQGAYIEETIYQGKKLLPCSEYRGKKVYNRSWYFGIDALQIGDYVDQDIADDIINCLPPAYMKYGFVQLGEPSAHKTNPRTGKIAAVYATFQQVAEGVWKYCGKCFIGEKVQVAL